MAQNASKDKAARDQAKVEERSDESEAQLARELIEAVAGAYFTTCRKLASLINRNQG